MHEDEDLAILTALEARDAADRLAKSDVDRQRKHRRRERLFRDADLLSHLAAQHGSELLDELIAGGWSATAFRRAESHVLDDLDLWLEATGERRAWLREAELRHLELWLYETHERRRQDHRYKPNKSRDHDAPWPGARKWSPRRWFGPCPSAPPLTISIAGAVDRREMLADVKGGGEAEYADDARCNAEGQWLTVRKVLEPGWLWNDVPVVDGFLKWKDQWDGLKWSPRYEPEVDEAPPDSVLRQRHEPPTEAPPSPAPRLPPGVKVRDYWRGVKGRPLARPKWRTPCVEELPGPEARRLLFLSEAKRRWWTTLRQRPPGATYEIDLAWDDARGTAPIEPSSHIARKPSKREMLLRFAFIGGGSQFGKQPFFVSTISSDVRSRLPSDEYPHRTVIGERLRSPYYPCGLWSYRSKHWVPDTPNKRPGAWAQQYVEGPAHELAAKRAELKRRREAAIDGLLSNFGY